MLFLALLSYSILLTVHRAKKDTAVLERIREAYGVPTSGKKTSASSSSSSAPSAATDHPLYTAGNEVLDLFHATVARYEQANEALRALRSRGDADSSNRGKDGSDEKKNSADALASSWSNDYAEVRKLLQYGRVYGDSLVREIILPNATPSAPTSSIATPGPVPESSLNQTGRSALDMFPRSRATVASGQTWGETARSQMQALTGLLRTLPWTGSRGSGNGGGSSRGVVETEQGSMSALSKSVSFDC